MEVVGYFDGACGPENPNGHAGYGVIIRRGSKVLFEEARYIGPGEGMTCNVAEYCGVIAVLKFLIANKIQRATIFGDSDLVIKQLNGKWKARKGSYLPYYKEAISLRARLPEVRLQWIPREENTDADYLSKQAINKPRSPEETRQLERLIESQRRDRFDPRFKVVASRPVKGAPF